MKKVLILAAGLALTVPAAVLGSRRNVRSTDALCSIAYSGRDSLLRGYSEDLLLTVDFPTHGDL